MSDETVPDVTEIKERLKIEVEEEAAAGGAPNTDISEELRRLGKQFAGALKSAWESEERQKLEGEVRNGLKFFAAEVDKVMQEVKQSPVTQKIKEEAGEIKAKAEKTELPQKARTQVITGIRWLSEELGKLADKFNSSDADEPVEKAPPTE